jgi:hypothetical protein
MKSNRARLFGIPFAFAVFTLVVPAVLFLSDHPTARIKVTRDRSDIPTVESGNSFVYETYFDRYNFVAEYKPTP